MISYNYMCKMYFQTLAQQMFGFGQAVSCPQLLVLKFSNCILFLITNGADTAQTTTECIRKFKKYYFQQYVSVFCQLEEAKMNVRLLPLPPSLLFWFPPRQGCHSCFDMIFRCLRDSEPFVNVVYIVARYDAFLHYTFDVQIIGDILEYTVLEAKRF